MAEAPEEALFKELKAHFESLRDKFPERDAEADRLIKRWRYAERSVFELQVEYFRRFNRKPGRLVDTEPTDAFMFISYGHDDQDRILCAASFQSEELPRLYTFYEYATDGIDLAEFGVELGTDRYFLNKVARLVQPSGQHPLYYGEYSGSRAAARRVFEEYHYDDLGRIARISSSHRFQPRPLTWDFGPQQADFFIEEIFEYKGETLNRILQRGHDIGDDTEKWWPETVLFEAPAPGETFEMLYAAARARLYDAVIQQIKQLEPAKRLQARYCLIISYDAVADDGILLILGLQARREAWEKKSSERSYRSLFYNTLDWRSDSLEMWDLPNNYVRFLRLHRRDENWETICDLLNVVARDLNNYDWKQLLNTTDDFIVFANDSEAMEDVHDEIHACVPEDKLRLLRDTGRLDEF
jgi:hypothetical protein